jgi:hypothetical protein
MQQNLEQAHEQGKLELDKWAANMIKRIRLNYPVQKIWTGDGTSEGPYKGFAYLNVGYKSSTGESFKKENMYYKVLKGAGGNTVAVDFFFRRYLLFVDWGVGAGQKKEQVPEHGVPKMTKLYHTWDGYGDRQRRPVVLGAIRGGQFGMLRILQDYWTKQAQMAVLSGFGHMDANGEYVEEFGDLQNGKFKEWK